MILLLSPNHRMDNSLCRPHWENVAFAWKSIALCSFYESSYHCLPNVLLNKLQMNDTTVHICSKNFGMDLCCCIETIINVEEKDR
jgi:hypothetical protein